MASDTELRIKASALQFNGVIKAPRTGITAKDPDLWGFAANISIPQSTLLYMKDQVGLIMSKMLTVFKECFQYQSPFLNCPFDLVLDFKDNGRVFGSDKDVLLVINSTSPLWPRKDHDNVVRYYNSTKERYVNGAAASLLSGMCCSAIDQFLLVQDQRLKLTPTIVERDVMTAFSMRDEEGCEGIPFEFNIIPVLRTIGDSYLLLDGKNGVLVPLSTRFSPHAIDIYTKGRQGAKEMMTVLGVIHKAGVDQGLKTLESVPVCAIENALVMILQNLREKATNWWRDSSFTTIFRAAIEKILNPDIVEGDPSNKLLRDVCQDKEFVDYYSRWSKIEEKNLLDELKTCFSSIGTNKRSAKHDRE